MILALDQGTTSSRSIIFDAQGNIISVAQQEFSQFYPEGGWVEHDAEEIWHTQLRTAQEAIHKAGIEPHQIKAIGITNQRETTVVWDAKTGKPIYNAIVWQDRRTAPLCESMKQAGWSNYIKENTGLIIDAYFSATKLHWILENVPFAREKAANGDLRFGTIDTWLMWNLTQGEVFATDVSNASRTMLFNIKDLVWDKGILHYLNINESLLPSVLPSSHIFGHTKANLFGIAIPIAGVAGDQQAALFGQGCFETGTAKNTYGTGCFMLMNTGNELKYSAKGLISTIAWQIGDKVTYALEGSVFIAGAAIQWLRDEVRILDNAAQSQHFALSVKDNGGVYVVPAFAGLGAPYWDMYARGAIFGLTRGSSKAHIIRATLESLAYQSKDLLTVMQEEAQTALVALRVDGGASANNFLMQFQADMLNVAVQRPKITESTAVGAACLAGLAIGLWDIETLKSQWHEDKQFLPTMDRAKAEKYYRYWQRAVQRVQDWTLIEEEV